MVNEHILSQIVNEQEREVFKTMRSDMSSAKALLNDEQFAQFMRAATIGFGKAELNATKLKALTSLLDDDKEDNIEREQFEQTLLTMMGEAVGVDLEAVCVYGDTTYTSGGNKDPLFSTLDGWLKGATAVKSDGAKGSGSADFVLANTGVVGMFDAMLKKLPAAYRQANLMKDLVFYVPYEVYEAYRAFLIDRETGLGDSTLLNADELKYKGIPVKYAPVLDATDGRTVYGKYHQYLLFLSSSGMGYTKTYPSNLTETLLTKKLITTTESDVMLLTNGLMQ